jgi:hypothetical protein
MFLMYRAIRVTVRKLPLGLPGGRGGWVPHVLLLRKVLSLRMRLACTLCGGRWYSSPIRLTSSLTHNYTNQVSSPFWQTRYLPWGWIFFIPHLGMDDFFSSSFSCFFGLAVWVHPLYVPAYFQQPRPAANGTTSVSGRLGITRYGHLNRAGPHH